MKRNQKGEIITVLVIASVVAITAGVTILANVLTSSKQTTQTKAREIPSCIDNKSQCMISSSTTVSDCFLGKYLFWCIDDGNDPLCCELPTATPTVAPTSVPQDFSCGGQWATSGITTACTYYDAGWYGNCKLRVDLYTNNPNTRRCCDDVTATMNGARGVFGGCATDPDRYVSAEEAGQPVQPTLTPTQLVKRACWYRDDPTCELCNIHPNFQYNGQSYSISGYALCDDYCRTQYTLPPSQLIGSRCPVEDSLRQPASTTKVLTCTSTDQSGCELCQNTISTSFTFGDKSYTWAGGSRAYCTNWCAQDGNVTKDEIPNSYCTNAFKDAKAAKKSVIDPNQVVKYKCGTGQDRGEDCNKCNYPEGSRNKQGEVVKWSTRVGCPAGRNPVAQNPTIGIPNETRIKFFMDKRIEVAFCEIEDNNVAFNNAQDICKAAGCKNNEKNCEAIKCRGDEFYNLIPNFCG